MIYWLGQRLLNKEILIIVLVAQSSNMFQNSEFENQTMRDSSRLMVKRNLPVVKGTAGGY